MSLVEQVDQATTNAMKSRDQVRVDTLRMVRAAFKNEEIAVGHALSDDEAIKVLQRQIKQRTDAAEQYRTAGRTDAAEKEEAEKTMIGDFLPEQMADADLDALVTAAITETGAASAADMGKVIGAVRTKAGSAADGSRIAAAVKAQLGA